jgi:hypothetical protein
LFRSQLLEGNSNSIGHNPFIKGDLCFVAYYHDGVQVFNIADTNNITRVAYYDTYTNTNYSGYDGVWGVYPYLSSGNIIASDDANGLFVLSLTEGVLPLDLIAFSATREKQDVRLRWNVTGAHAEEDFLVEYSKDGIHFHTLTEIPSEDNDWNYAHIHADPGPGIHYYRINLRSRDGQLTPSAIQSVELSGQTQFIVKATLVTDVLTLDVNGSAEITLIGTDGRQLLYKEVLSSARVELLMTQFPAGQYYVVFRSGDTEEVQSVTKL